MKALVLESVGNLIYEDVPTPVPQDGEVLLKVKACGICSSDFDRCLKTGTYHFPTIPGHEFAGEIAAVGSGVDASYIGKRAVVFPLIPCRSCDQCRIEAYARCRNYSYFGSRCDGAFAEYVAVPLWNIQVFDATLDYNVAALCEPAAVAYHSVATSALRKGARVCIVGTGTIGVMVGFWARETGADVTFVSRNESKAAFLQTLGFDSMDGKSAIADGGFTCAFECVGTDASLAIALGCVGASGQVILLGNPDGDKSIERKVFWKILRSELTVKGIWNSNYSKGNNDWRKVLDALLAHQVSFSRLITSVFPLSAGLAAFDALRNSGKLELKGMFINE